MALRAKRSFKRRGQKHAGVGEDRADCVRGQGKKIHYFIANDRAMLLYLTNLGCIDHNPWSSRAGSVENPDYIFLTWTRRTARLLRRW